MKGTFVRRAKNDGNGIHPAAGEIGRREGCWLKNNELNSCTNWLHSLDFFTNELLGGILSTDGAGRRSVLLDSILYGGWSEK